MVGQFDFAEGELAAKWFMAGVIIIAMAGVMIYMAINP